MRRNRSASVAAFLLRVERVIIVLEKACHLKAPLPFELFLRSYIV